MTKENNNIYEPLATKPNTTIEYNYEIFDSCRLSNNWSPNWPVGPVSKSIRYPYTKLEVVGFDTLKPKTCIIRNEFSWVKNSYSDSIFTNQAYGKFPSNYGGAPYIDIRFKGDSIFIESARVEKYSSRGYELRGIRK